MNSSAPLFLFGDEAHHKLGTVFLVSVDAFVEQHFAYLRNIPLFVVRNSLDLTFQFGTNSKRQKLSFRHNGNIAVIWKASNEE